MKFDEFVNTIYPEICRPFPNKEIFSRIAHYKAIGKGILENNYLIWDHVNAERGDIKNAIIETINNLQRCNKTIKGWSFERALYESVEISKMITYLKDELKYF